MTASKDNEAAPEEYINREHTTFQYVFMLTSVSMCITVDILQYAMPLAFLPSVLEDRGHSPMNIATAIGVYYWTGLLGGIVLTSYEVWRMLYVKDDHKVDATPFATVRQQIKVVIANLGVGVITLFVQAWLPLEAIHPYGMWEMHTFCRFIQGFVGAFLFFYVFLLNVAIFKGQQQVMAMTLASCATVLAELAGPLLGSIIFDTLGQRAVFWTLGAVSLVNQAMLVGVLYMISPTTDAGTPKSAPMLPNEASPVVSETDPDEADGNQKMEKWWSFMKPQPGTVSQLTCLLKNPTFICANLIITMSAGIKGSVEEMLPFHADHQWGYEPMQIGQLFCTTAVAFFFGAAIVSQIWTNLGRFQVAFSSQCIMLLGVTACMSFHVAYYYKDETVLYGTFAGYGFCAGLSFTAAAQLIAEVVDSAEGHTKDAANGIWNTMWEVGGSTGFFLGGFLAHHYKDQMMLITRCAICAVVTAICMLVVRGFKANAASDKASDKLGKLADYGSTA